MTLVIDIGNTYTKIAVFKQDELLHTEQFENVDTAIINRLLNDHQVTRAIISSVKKEKDGWQTELAKKVALTWFSREMTKGITNHYQSF